MQDKQILALKSFSGFVDLLKKAPPPGRRRPLSIRQLSKELGYKSPGTISNIFGGHRAPSFEMLEKICDFYRISPFGRTHLAKLAGLGAKRATAVKDPGSMLVDFKPLAEDRFRHIAEWYHFPLGLLMTLLKDGTPIEEIARFFRGKVSASEIFYGLQRLKQYGLLTKDAHGNYVFNTSETTVDIPSAVNRSHIRQMIERSLEALEEQPVENREISSLTFTIDPTRVAEAKDFIRAFRHAFLQRFMGPKSSCVAQLNIQLFEHTETVGEKYANDSGRCHSVVEQPNSPSRRGSRISRQ